ncbi:hypothetical protein D9601_12090 [Sphingomonas sp. MA1305]|uniref:hypothetical protein n=1 Tax=Sphingomonas sp. MA1305 TaxID=2479204 RepID=UPI001E378E4A|nr:hypothetical protein [Sphingomonas sp. MA1305]MBI0476091.1 hypothetical protein [Sphingomonas sp. MA1305]
MAEHFDPGEDGLAARQDAKLYPVGRALRTTFDADNHDTLSRDVTALMLDLARIPYDEADRTGPPVRRPIAPPTVGEQQPAEHDAQGSGLSALIRGVVRRVMPAFPTTLGRTDRSR